MARKFGGSPSESAWLEFVVLSVEAVPLLKLDEGKGGKGGGGESGRDVEEGVAFSMRAQVR